MRGRPAKYHLSSSVPDSRSEASQPLLPQQVTVMTRPRARPRWSLDERGSTGIMCRQCQPEGGERLRRPWLYVGARRAHQGHMAPRASADARLPNWEEALQRELPHVNRLLAPGTR